MFNNAVPVSVGFAPFPAVGFVMLTVVGFVMLPVAAFVTFPAALPPGLHPRQALTAPVPTASAVGFTPSP